MRCHECPRRYQPVDDVVDPGLGVQPPISGSLRSCADRPDALQRDLVLQLLKSPGVDRCDQARAWLDEARRIGPPEDADLGSVGALKIDGPVPLEA